MEIIQLVTMAGPLPWWTAVEQSLQLEAQVDARPQAAASIYVVARAEIENLRSDERLNAKTIVVADANWTPQNLMQSLRFVMDHVVENSPLSGGILFLDTAEDVDVQARVLRVAVSRQSEIRERRGLMQILREQNRKIEELNRDLEKTMAERTLTEEDSRRASRRNITKMREIIGSIKELAQLFEVSELLPLIRRQIKEYHSLEAPILFIPRGEDLGDIYYLQGSHSARSRVRGPWEISARILVNETRDRQFLANALGRPVAKVIRFPMITVRHQRDVGRSPLLFFEHNLKPQEQEEVVSALGEKLQPVSWALDRLILEQELKGSSRDWESTFDELSEPIAILDEDGRVLRANSHWRSEFRDVLSQTSLRLRFGATLYTVEKYPIRMTSEEPPISWVVYLRDETRSQRLKTQVVQIEKMSAIGQLAGHIAHELNNPLTGIRSLAQVLLSDLKPESQTHKDLQEVELASARCQGIINNLLEFSKGDIEHRIQAHDLNEVVRRTLPLLKSAIGRFRHEIDLSPSSLTTRVEPHLLQQVIFNLINNACQAMTGKGDLAIRTFKDEKWAILEIQDSGPGIASELQERIFEPFFTTKAEGEGTGLGLSLSRDFVRQFGGELDCESSLGQGATFRVRLPVEMA